MWNSYFLRKVNLQLSNSITLSSVFVKTDLFVYKNSIVLLIVSDTFFRPFSEKRVQNLNNSIGFTLHGVGCWFIRYSLLSSLQSVSYFFVRFWKSSRVSQSCRSFKNLSRSSCFANFSMVSLALGIVPLTFWHLLTCNLYMIILSEVFQSVNPIQLSKYSLQIVILFYSVSYAIPHCQNLIS